jgi:hypothetical protein
LGANVGVMVYSVASIELLIRYNNITGVHTLLSTGQIIPFIIGIASLWRVCWQIMTDFAEHQAASNLVEERKGAERSTTDVISEGSSQNFADNAVSLDAITIDDSG